MPGNEEHDMPITTRETPMARTRSRVSATVLAALTCATLIPIVAVPVAVAEELPAAQTTPEQSLLADFTFDSAPTAGVFADRDARATVQGTANLVAGQAGQGQAVRLSPSFWLDVKAADGQALLKGRNSITLSYDSKPDAAQNVGWTVFAARSVVRQEFAQEHYLGILDRTTGIIVERYDNTGTRITSGNLTTSTANAEWKHVDLVISGSTARLYVDKKPVAVNAAGRTLTQILGAEGGVLQVGKANWGAGEYFTGMMDNLRIYDRALTGAELGAQPSAVTSDIRAALAVPALITDNLPSQVLGHTVTWVATGIGAGRVTSSGAVNTGGLNGAKAPVRLQATVDGTAETFTWDSEIVAPGGRVATYVKTVTTTNGAKDDPLAYNDDRRADAMYAAALPAGASTWEPLNRSQAILYVANDGDQQVRPNSQVGSPSLFRYANGSLGAITGQNNATDSVYVWTSADGRTFRDQRAVQIAPGSVITDPRVIYDTATQKYKVFWTDLLTGEGRVTVLTDLTAAASAGGVTTKADTRTLGVAGAGLPTWITQSQASEFALTSAEFDAFYKNYVDLQNTGVKALGATVPQGASESTIASALPKQAVMEYNDGSTKNLDVDWQDNLLAQVDTSKAGTYEVTGVVQQDPEEMVTDARADPHVFFNPDDGYYYLTGSHYGQPSTGPIEESSSYRKIGLKRAKTLEGLKDVQEQIVIDPDAGTPGHEAQYPNTFYGWGGFIWAQEFHKINGTWWIVAGMNKGYAPVGGWCDNTVLIPYTGTDESIKDGGFFDKTKWGEPVVLDGAAFDVSYFERTEAGKQQGYWVMPIFGEIKIGKVKAGPKGTVPLVDGELRGVYRESQAWEIGKQAPTPSDTTEGRDQGVVEAPFMVQQGDEIYLSYSGGTVDKYYSMGMLTAGANADLQNPASWTQTPFPVLTTNDTFSGRIGADETTYTKEHAGTGHHSFTHDPAGNLLLAYHARPYPDPHQVSDPNGAGGLFDSDRNTWFKAVNVRANGALDLSLAKDQEVAPANRTVKATVTVEAYTAKVTATASARCVAGKVVVVVTAKNGSASVAEILWETPWGTRAQQIQANKSSSVTFSTRVSSVAEGTLSGIALVEGSSTPVTASYAGRLCG